MQNQELRASWPFQGPAALLWSAHFVEHLVSIGGLTRTPRPAAGSSSRLSLSQTDPRRHGRRRRARCAPAELGPFRDAPMRKEALRFWLACLAVVWSAAAPPRCGAG